MRSPERSSTARSVTRWTSRTDHSDPHRATASATDLVIATVNNGHMIEMQKVTPHFEKANPGIKLKWVTPNDLPFPMPVPVVIDGKMTRVPMPKREGQIAIPEGATYEVDPEQLVLKEEGPRRRNRGR